jgi:hypothetical protein
MDLGNLRCNVETLAYLPLIYIVNACEELPIKK